MTRSMLDARLLCTIIALTCVGCFLKRPVDYEREYAKTLAPKKIESAATATVAGPVRHLRVRVYADADHRAQVLHWERAIEAQLQRASAVVEPLGVRFTLESARMWNHVGTRELEPALLELEAFDAGEDVDLVIGLVTGLSLFTSSQHQLGLARQFGRHCVLRGMDNLEEANAILAGFQHLPVNEREELYRERKLHKQTSVLLHEWAHTLGAFHVNDSRWMMHPSYDPAQGAFAQATLDQLALSLRHLPRARHSAEEQKAWAKELQAYLTQTVWPEWEGPEKEETLVWTASVLANRAPVTTPPATTPPPATPPSAIAVPLPPADQKRVEEVLALDQQGRFDEAAQKLQPLVARYPNDERVLVTSCYLAVRTAPTQAATRERCDAALARLPNQLALLMTAALIRLQNNHAEEAPAFLLRARQQLQAQPTAPPERWAELADLFQMASCVTWAEEAAQRASGVQHATQVLAWAAQQRRWHALPADVQRSGVAVEHEGAFLRTVREVETLITQNKIAAAQKHLKVLTKEFPTAPAVQVLQCELKARVGEYPAARAACTQALAADEQASQAHYILGRIAIVSKSGKEARAHLERVIALTPTREDAWRLLIEQYQLAKMTKEMNEVGDRYVAQFPPTE